MQKYLVSHLINDIKIRFYNNIIVLFNQVSKLSNIELTLISFYYYIHQYSLSFLYFIVLYYCL